MVIKHVEKAPPTAVKVAWALGIVSLGTLAGSIMLIMSFVLIAWGLPLLGFSAVLGLLSLAISAVALSSGVPPKQVIGNILVSTPGVLGAIIAFVLFFA